MPKLMTYLSAALATGLLLPVVWRIGDRVITWTERAIAQRQARRDGTIDVAVADDDDEAITPRR